MRDTTVARQTCQFAGKRGRGFFSGPGIDIYDRTLQKTTKITESKPLGLRLKASSAFNQAQFYGPQAVQGNIGSAALGVTLGLTWHFRTR
jgi:hypothetical protein